MLYGKHTQTQEHPIDGRVAMQLSIAPYNFATVLVMTLYKRRLAMELCRLYRLPSPIQLSGFLLMESQHCEQCKGAEANIAAVCKIPKRECVMN